MQALNDWIANIVIFILVAVIMELLVPNTQLQKYVKMVVGLLLILLLVSPLLNIFTVNLDDVYETIRAEQKISEDLMENNMNKQKKEIQATQSAYIEEQMAVQMKRQVEEELMEQYELQISQLTIEFDTDDLQNYENIKAVYVALNNNDNRNVKKVENVQKVTIQRETNSSRATNRRKEQVDSVKNFLANRWGIEREKLEIDIISMDGREIS